MTDPMDQPVTKRELAASFDAFLPVLMDHFRKELDTRFAEAHRDTLTAIRASADDIRMEIRTLEKTNERRHRDDIAVIDEKYKSLPARVKKLEAVVFKPAPLKRRRTR